MEKKLNYSVLRYSPSAISGEKINLGIILCDEESNYREFYFSKKFSRLSSFDDEINLKMVKTLLYGIEEEVSGDLFSYEAFDIEKFTKFYVNDFAFDKPKTISYTDLEDTVSRLKKTYFRFDFEKKERPSKER